MSDHKSPRCNSSHLKLIINADDVGYSQIRDEGIAECIDAGSVTSCSLLVNGVSAKSIIIARCPKVSLGLHLNLTEGCPIGSLYDTLTNEEGFFRGKFGFREAVDNGKIDSEEISEEIDHQIRTFWKLTDQKPTHIDGHQHIHVIPAIMKILAPQMVSNAINITRIPHERQLNSCHWLSQTSRSFFERVIDDALVSKDICLKNGIHFSDAFLGLSTMGTNMSIRNLQKRIYTVLATWKEKQPKNAGNTTVMPWLCELMVHPGYVTGNIGGCGTGPDDFSQSNERQHEMEILKEMALMNFYQKHGIELISFKALF
ncbi:carbohydrate deacetylase isoform X1 [Octopus bimaculoides]|uniref:Carbohydrate deacetylase n=1 Tax=Octopus bimaculoides TaxID=37653 RepID=A0A0L8GTB9_OCTBM|nr:carbohydrate deacetylase isoform X1 [Octopus bimaculoides]|eukprot:XP_014778293.1 PREDICTED: carbohydrate deacetylase-like isoform X1 [Octopus bimaculoides]